MNKEQNLRLQEAQAKLREQLLPFVGLVFFRTENAIIPAPHYISITESDIEAIVLSTSKRVQNVLDIVYADNTESVAVYFDEDHYKSLAVIQTQVVQFPIANGTNTKPEAVTNVNIQ